LIKRTACSRDCPDACALEAEVVEGRLVSLKGVKEDPVTKGFLCPRTTRFVERQYSVDRIRSPLVRDGNGFREIGWDEALDLCAEKLKEARDKYGADSILHYKSGGAMGYLKALVSVFFEQFGPVSEKRGDICSGAGEWAQETDFGLSDSSEVEDLYNSKLILIWGKNVHTSSVHLLPTLLEAKRRGTILVGIDPVPTKASRISDLFLCPRAGTDAQLALALVSFLEEHGGIHPEAPSYCQNLDDFLAMARAVSFEQRMQRCGLSNEDGRRLAKLYLENTPSSILIGWGAPRRPNGAATVRALDGLAAVSGNIGVAGACASFYFQRRRHFRRAFLPAPTSPPRTFSETRLGIELETAQPRVRLAWITAGNPVAMLPDAQRVGQALRAIDFTVVVDTHHTDTTACADLVLPTLSLVEDDDLMGAYGNHYLRVSQPVLPPEGEARHELWIFQQLAKRLGLGDFLEGSPREWKDRLLDEKVDRALLDGKVVRQPGAPRVVFEGRVFPTASGKVHLMTTEPALPDSLSAEFPLRLMAVSHPDAQSSQWSVEPPAVPTAQISEDSPSAWVDGSQMRLESKKAGFTVKLQRVEGLHPELVVLPKGGSGLFGGWCPNDLIEARETDQGGGACFYDEPVRLVPLI
jgi:anaerobic selenocysteine-containing dehydrogenase